MQEESFGAGVIEGGPEYPRYTRSPRYQGVEMPRPSVVGAHDTAVAGAPGGVIRESKGQRYASRRWCDASRACLARCFPVEAASLQEGSFGAGMIEGGPEYPQYTRPPCYQGLEVPRVLRSGDAAAIRRWRAGHSGRGRSWGSDPGE